MATPVSQSGALDTSKIAGNGSDELKQLLGDIGEFFHSRRAAGMITSGFGEAIQRRLRVTEISFNKKAEEERKKEARMVMETEVHEGTYFLWAYCHWPRQATRNHESFVDLVILIYILIYRYAERWWKYSWRMFSIPGRYVRWYVATGAEKILIIVILRTDALLSHSLLWLKKLKEFWYRLYLNH